MKRMALFLLTAFSILLGDYRIEVLRIDANATVPEPLLQRIAVAGYSCAVFEEGEQKSVMIGPFKDEKAAGEELGFIRCRFAPDARIRELEALPKALLKAASASAEIDTSSRGEEKSASAEKEGIEACRCVCTKKGMAEYRICKALHYYRCSPFYTFEGE